MVSTLPAIKSKAGGLSSRLFEGREKWWEPLSATIPWQDRRVACSRSRKSHPRGFAPEGESGQHHMRCLQSSICLRCSSPICSNRGGSWKSRTSFFVTSSTSPSGVHRAVCGCVGATGRCWYGCHGFGQACFGRPGSFSLTRYCGGIEQDFAPIGAGSRAASG